MSESGNNIHSNQGNGASLPNGTNPNNNTNSTNNTTPMTGNNITVSIEYMYETPNISATQNNSNNNNNNSNNNNNTNNAGSTRPTNSTSESPHSETTTSQHSQPQQQPPPGGMRPFPPGVVFLQFRDIPAGNTQERLQTIMNIASEIAVRRIVDLSNVRYNRGITKEKFESLPVIPIKELDPTVKEDGCSICYEPFVDSIPDIVSDENKKRNRDDDDNEKEGSENNRRKKKLRSDSSDGDDNNNNSNNIDTSPINNLSANIGDVNSGGTSTENTTTNTNSSEAQITNDEETNPTYDHSAVKAPCGHIFGRECLYKWCKSENTCPLCRQVIAESVNTPIAVDPAQAAATTNAAFQRIHDLLYNTNNVNNNSNSTENNNGNIPVATNGTNNNNSIPSTSNQQSTTTATASTTVIPTPSTTTTSTTNIPFRTSNIVFITPQWYIPPNTTSTTATATATASATASAGSGSTTVSDGNTSRSENNETQTANDTSDNNLNQNERPSPYERFRTIIGSYFDGLLNQNNYSNNNTNNTNSSESPSNDPTVNGNRITNTNFTFSATPGNVQNATRNLDLLAMGNSIRNALLQQRNVLSDTYNNGDTPTLFNSGVASYRTSSGNVSTYHLGAHEVFHASTNNNNNNTTVGSTSTDNQNGDNNESSHSSSGGDGTSLRNNEQEENNSNNNYTNTSTS